MFKNYGTKYNYMYAKLFGLLEIFLYIIHDELYKNNNKNNKNKNNNKIIIKYKIIIK
jgi:hypothetical protein